MATTQNTHRVAHIFCAVLNNVQASLICANSTICNPLSGFCPLFAFVSWEMDTCCHYGEGKGVYAVEMSLSTLLIDRGFFVKVNWGTETTLLPMPVAIARSHLNYVNIK